MMQHEEDKASDTGTLKDYIAHRLLAAKDSLDDAKLLLREQRYRSANNRAYYAIFHAINTVHALNGKGFKSHKQSIAEFNRAYIHEGIFPKTFGHKIAKSQEKRHSSDYDYEFTPSEQETIAHIKFADEFLSCIRDFCMKRFKDDKNTPQT